MGDAHVLLCQVEKANTKRQGHKGRLEVPQI